jgi:hypothetical protein
MGRQRTEPVIRNGIRMRMNFYGLIGGCLIGGCAALIHPTATLFFVGWISDSASTASAVRRHSVGWISDSASTKATSTGAQR